MKKTFWQWLTTPIGCKDYYEYWDKHLNKVESNRMYRLLPAYQITNTYKMGKLTEEQYNELLHRHEILKIKKYKASTFYKRYEKEHLEIEALKKIIDSKNI